MKNIKKAGKKIGVGLIILALVMGVFPTLLNITPVAATTKWTAGFENYNPTNEQDKGLNTTTDEAAYVKSGTKAGMITSLENTGAGAAAGNTLILKSDDGNMIEMESGANYLVGFYAKVSNDFTGSVRLDLGKHSWKNAAGNYLSWATTSQFSSTVAAEMKTDWKFGYISTAAPTMAATNPTKYISLYLNRNNSTNIASTVGSKIYIDNATVVKYAADEKVIMINYNDGRDIEYLAGVSGTAANIADPTRDGYIFNGWYTNEACSTAFNGNYPTANTMIYADWIKKEYTVDFEKGYASTENISTDAGFIKGGAASAKLFGVNGTTNATTNNKIILRDADGNLVKFKDGYKYAISGYVKAQSGYTGKIRIDALKDSQWAGYSSTFTANGEWQHFYFAASGSAGQTLGLFATGNGAFDTTGAYIYLDNIKVVAFESTNTGVVFTKEYNKDEYTYQKGASGASLANPTSIPGGKEFKGWYNSSDSKVTTFTAGVQAVTAKYGKPDANGQWAIGYEEGSEYNWVASDKGATLKNGFSKSTIDVSNEQHHTGNYSLKIDTNAPNNNSNNNDVANFVLSYETTAYATKFGYDAERDYVLSFWYYVPTGAEAPKGFIETYSTYTNSTQNFGTPNKLVNDTTRLNFSTDTKIGEWVYYSVNITTPNVGASAWTGGLTLKWMSLSPVTTTVYIDDILITRIDDIAVPSKVELTKDGPQVLNNEYFALADNKQAIRFNYNIKKVAELASVDLRGLDYKVKEVGMLTALETLIGTTDKLNLDELATNANIQNAKVDLTNIRLSDDQSKNIFSTYIKGISKDYIDFKVASRPYVILESAGIDKNEDIIIYGDVSSYSMKDILTAVNNGSDQALKDACANSLVWAEIVPAQ